MATIGLICPDEEDRRRLSLIAGESGHLTYAAARLPEAVEILRERRPRLMLVVDAPGQDARILLREVLRVAPLLPIVVALKNRDAGRAVELMRTGAAEVVAPPWTREGLGGCLSKALRLQGTVFSMAPPRARPSHVYFFGVLLFFGLCFGVVSLERRGRRGEQALALRSHWDLPYRNPSAMAFDGSELWISDWFTQTLYVHAAQDLALRRLVHFPTQTPVAIAVAANAVWAVEASGVIVRHMKDASLTPLQRYRDAAPNTLGLAFDGLYLWTCDSRQRRVHKRLVDAELTLLASYFYPGAAPSALAFDGKTLWSLDAANRELVRHNLERPEEAAARIPLPEYRDGKYRPVGLGWDGGRFWTVAEKQPRDSGPARVFRHAPLSD